MLENTLATPNAPHHKPTLAVGGKVGAIVPQDIDQVFRLAKAVDAARWAPKSYLLDPKKPDAGYDLNRIVLGIMHGMELGLTPIAALQSIAVINGIPSIYGDGALAIVQASGLLEDFREEPMVEQIKAADGTEKARVMGFRCTVKRRGIASFITSTFTLEDAQKADLLSKPGPWQQYRPRMLQMRARAWALRAGFADVLRGVAFAEEAQDIVIDVEAKKSVSKPKPTAKAALDAFASPVAPPDMGVISEEAHGLDQTDEAASEHSD